MPGSGDLDQFSGRWCKTPEFPNGTYAYFLPIDAAGNPIFSFIVNRQMYGQPNGSGKVTSITEPVTVAFNVATNVAPVVSGPAGVSLPHAGTLAFPGANAIGVSPGAKLTLDVGAADLAVTAITLDAGGLIDLGYGRMTIASGGVTEAGVRSWLKSGRGDGTWAGTTGIVSRAAPSITGGSIGYATNDDGSLTVAFAVAGDTNLDGVVDLLDLANLMASGLYDSGAASGWQTGDFNDDGVVDLLDVVELLSTGLYDVGSYVLAAQEMPSTSRIE